MTTSNESTLNDQFRDEKVVFFIFFGILIGCVVREINQKLRIPYTPLVLASAIAIGHFRGSLGLIGSAAKSFYRIHPRLMLQIFAPTLAFTAAYHTYWYSFRRSLANILLLACPGTIIHTVLLAVIMQNILGYTDDQLPWTAALFFGAALSATDPVAVVSILQDMGSSVRCNTLIDGESMLNNAFSLVLFQIFIDQYKGVTTTSLEAGIEYFRMVLIGPLVGFLFAIAICAWLRQIIRDDVLTVTIMFCASYMCFFICQYAYIEVSGFLALTVLGIMVSSNGQTQIYSENDYAISTVFSWANFAILTTVYILVGTLIGVFFFEESTITQDDWVKLGLFYVLIHFARMLTLGILSPLMQRYGYVIDKNEVAVMVFGGLRGPMALTMSIIILTDPKIDERHQQLCVFYIAGIVSLTTIFNGTTTGLLVSYLHIINEPPIRKTIFKNSLKQIVNVYTSSEAELKKDINYNNVKWEDVRELTGTADWQRNIQIIDDKGIQLKQNSSSDALLQDDCAQDIRFRILRSLQGIIWDKFQMGNISGQGMKLLEETCNLALENTFYGLDTLLWDNVQLNFVAFGSIKFWLSIKDCFIIGSVARRLLTKHLAFVYEVTTTFIASLEESIKLSRNIPIVKDEIAKTSFDTIRGEIENEIARAEQYLLNLDQTFTDMIKGIQTRRATFELIHAQKAELEKYLKNGHIDEDDFDELIKQLDKKIISLENEDIELKAIHINQITMQFPIFSCLDDDQKIELQNNSNENIVKKGNTLYTASNDNSQVYLILQGTVQESFPSNGSSIYRGIGSILSGGFLFAEGDKSLTTATVLTDEVMVVIYDKQDFMRFMDKNKSFQRKFYQSSLLYQIKLFHWEKSSPLIKYEKISELNKLSTPAVADVVMLDQQAAVIIDNGGIVLKGTIKLNGKVSQQFSQDKIDILKMNSYIPAAINEYVAVGGPAIVLKLEQQDLIRSSVQKVLLEEADGERQYNHGQYGNKEYEDF